MNTISLVSIVKDAAPILRECLESVRSLIDEWVVVDTGSTDGTQAIIEEYSGFVRALPFEDFVATKNKALEMATGDYVLFMDADERLISGVDRLRQYAESGADCVLGIIVEGDPDHPDTVYYRPRLWRNHGQYQFEGPGVHEYIPLRGKLVYDDQVRVLHDHRHRSPESYRVRFLQYKDILERRLSVDPSDARAVFYLARALRDLNYPWQAIERYDQYLSMSSGYLDECWQAAYEIAQCWQSLGEYGEAQRAIERAKTIDPRRAEAWTFSGLMFFRVQEWREAADQFRHALALPVPRDVLLFIEPKAYSETPRDHLAICLDRMRDYRGVLALFDQDRREGAPVVYRVNDLRWLRSRTSLKIFFGLGETPESVFGGLLEERGAGGLETSYIELPIELAKLGHDVFVFCRCPDEHVSRGVRYVPWSSYGEYTRLSADVIVTSRWFDSMYAIGTARAKKVIWLHDSRFADPERAGAWQMADRVVVSSEWHRQYTGQRLGHGTTSDRLRVIPLGIRKDLFIQAVARDEQQVIYSSNPDRGLFILRDMWDEISERCPGISLVVAYGWEGLKTWSSDPAWLEKIEADRLALLEWARKAKNVSFTGRLNKMDLANMMLRSSLCLYPNNFQETFCLTALETQAAGVPMITTRYGALDTTLDRHCNVLIPLDPYGAEYRKQFIAAAADLYNDADKRHERSRRCVETVRQRACDWKDIAHEWETLLFEVVS